MLKSVCPSGPTCCSGSGTVTAAPSKTIMNDTFTQFPVQGVSAQVLNDLLPETSCREVGDKYIRHPQTLWSALRGIWSLIQVH